MQVCVCVSIHVCVCVVYAYLYFCLSLSVLLKHLTSACLCGWRVVCVIWLSYAPYARFLTCRIYSRIYCVVLPLLLLLYLFFIPSALLIKYLPAFSLWHFPLLRSSKCVKSLRISFDVATQGSCMCVCVFVCVSPAVCGATSALLLLVFKF